MTQVNYFTKEGFNKLKDELVHLTSIERPSISRQIAEARDKGDLSENAEYDAAKDAQGLLEAKIAKLQEQISKARIIDESKIDTSKVLILTTVKIKNVQNGAIMSYAIVPDNESDLKQKKLAVSSPIATGLLGKKVGDTAEIEVPAGKLTFEIIDISL